MSQEDLPKLCPSCNQRDATSFSKCRFCGTRYDATMEKVQSPNITGNVMIVIFAALSILGIYQVTSNAMKEAHARRFAPLAAEVKAAQKPRVLEFYADWCGPCRDYGPIVEASSAKFSGRVDFKRFNIDHSASKLAVSQVGVGAIPHTCILDRNGNVVADQVGTMSQESLDILVSKALAVN